MTSLRWATAGAVALFVYTLLSAHLPAVHGRAGVLASALVTLPLLAVTMTGLTGLRLLRHRLLAVAAAGLVAAVLLNWLRWAPGANLAKLLFAASLGLWLALQIEKVAIVVLIAGLSLVVDIISVFLGPTKLLLAQGPVVVGYFTFAMAWFGYAVRDVYSALGVSDLIFFALYVRAAQQFGLRPRLTAAALAASLLVTFVIGFWASALPALPLMAVAFGGVNGDLLWRALRRPRSGRRRAPA